MSTFTIPGSFASIAIAVADPGVVSGDTLEIQAGYFETLSTTLTISKDLTIIGMGAGPSTQLIQTAGLVGDPNVMIFINSPDVKFQNIEFRHDKPSTVNNTIFSSSALNKLTLDTCELYHGQYAILGTYTSLTVLNTNYYVSTRGNPTNAPIHNNITGLDGINTFSNITFDAVGNLMGVPATHFIYAESSFAFPFANTGDTTLAISNCTFTNVGTLISGCWIEGFNMGAGIINLDCRNNNWNVQSNGRSAYVFYSVPPKTNILNDFGSIRFSGNRHNANGYGMLCIQSFGGPQVTLGAINGDWTLCNNHVSQNITLPGYSRYHFGPKHPTANKLVGIDDTAYVNPFPTNNPYQLYIDCAAGGDFSQYLLRIRRPPRHQHRYNRSLF